MTIYFLALRNFRDSLLLILLNLTRGELLLKLLVYHNKARQICQRREEWRHG